MRTSGGARSVLLRMAADQERADRIKALKQERPDLTWRRIADHVGVTERSANDWQTKGGIEYANAEKLAEIFEVDVDYIWRGSPPTAPDLSRPDVAAAERLERMEQRLDAHAQNVEKLLARQSNVLKRIEDAVKREREARAATEVATKSLLDAAALADRYLRGDARSSEAEPDTPATSG